MDAVRRAKIEVLIPILQAVEDVVHDVFAQEEGTLGSTVGNLKETPQAQRSKEAFVALNNARNYIGDAVDELKEAIGNDQPELPATPPRISRRGL
jgi:hypothetical protein